MLWKGGFRSAATVYAGGYMTGPRGALATMERELHEHVTIR